MKEPVKVVMLPTGEKSTVYKLDNETLHIGEFAKCKKEDTRRVNQYVYITISQEVEALEVGDWFYNPQFNVISHKNDVAIKTHKGCRKIITTDDPKLLPVIDESDNMKTDNRYVGLPQLQQSFIREFVVNPDGEFEVEYEQLCTEDRLKLNQENEVNVTPVSKCDCTYVQACRICGEKKDLDGDFWKNLPPVKEKMYSKSEVIQMIWDLHNGVLNGDELKWIKENL